MQTPELLEFIRTETAKGSSRESIAASLLKEGWALEDVEGALGGTVPTQPAPAPATLPSVPVAIMSKNVIWTKRIPYLNRISAVISVLLVFTLDLYIVTNERSLREFWYMMLGVLGIFTVFYFLENVVFRHFLTNTASTSLDKWMMGIVMYRNFVFVLNTIPYVQLAGLAALYITGIPFLILYSIVIALRLKDLRRQ